MIPLEDIEPDTDIDVLRAEPMFVVDGNPRGVDEVDADERVVAIAEMDEVDVVETLALPFTEEGPESRPC